MVTVKNVVVKDSVKKMVMSNVSEVRWVNRVVEHIKPKRGSQIKLGGLNVKTKVQKSPREEANSYDKKATWVEISVELSVSSVSL